MPEGPTATRARVLTLNCRRSDLLIGPSWTIRRPLMAAFLARVKPSVIGVQECTGTQRRDILADLGGAWAAVYRGNVGVLYDGAKWELVDWQAHDLAAAMPRRLVLAHLRSRRTGTSFWVGSTHLTVHVPGQARLRVRQARAIGDLVPEPARTALCGDYNEPLTASGVRKELAAAGLTALRKRVTVRRGDYNTFHGWSGKAAKPTRRNGEWLDDIVTGRAITPYDAAVVLTGRATDHNGVLARIAITPNPEDNHVEP